MTIPPPTPKRQSARIEQKALQGGSRFNVHFSTIDGRMLTPAALVEALSKYVDFSDGEAVSFLRPTAYRHVAAGDTQPGVVRLGPPTTYLKEGLSTRELFRLLGQPAGISERGEKGFVVTTYEFPRGAGRTLIAEFVGGVLVRAGTEAHGQVLRAGSSRY